MHDLIGDVLYFMQTSMIRTYNLSTQEHFSEFLVELDLQEQINETELSWSEE